MALGWSPIRKMVQLLLVALPLVTASCALNEQSWRSTVPYPDRGFPPPVTAPEIVHCTDTIGHIEGTAPFVFGGRCCCNPSLKVLRAYQRAGYLPDWTVDTLRSAYGNRGITTLRDHRQCNDLCENGPHVVKGGRCLVPPSPGTLNHEEVISGVFALTPWELKQVSLHGGPVILDPVPTVDSGRKVQPLPHGAPD